MISPAYDLEFLVQKEKQREEDFKALDAVREAFNDVPDEELEREIARAVSAVHARSR